MHIWWVEVEIPFDGGLVGSHLVGVEFYPNLLDFGEGFTREGEVKLHGLFSQLFWKDFEDKHKM